MTKRPASSYLTKTVRKAVQKTAKLFFGRSSLPLWIPIQLGIWRSLKSLKNVVSMSEKRNHSVILSASSDTSAESLITEPTRKRWKSQQHQSSVVTETIRPILSSNNNHSTSEMTDVHDGIVDVDSVLTKNGSFANSPGHNQKQIRYDRQLRLWGDHGQEVLESAHVCLLNATAIGTEVLKSLILPGVGAFTIIDGETVSGADVGSNFFLESSFIGQSRARVACDLLQELNPEVRGSYIDLSPEKAIDQYGLAALDKFTVVIGTNLKRKTISTVGEYLFNRGIPFLICQSYGLIGYIRLLIKEHPIIESHPDSPLPNLMLDQPFAELTQLIEATNLETMDHKDHSHTPYLILLFKALDSWRRNKNDPAAFPNSYQEKREVKEILLSMRQPDEKGMLDEENFQEAINSVNSALIATKVPSGVASILNDGSAQEVTAKSSNFWIICNALRRFVHEHGRLPVRGVLPDMISDSDRYVKLQNVFLRKAEEEAAIVHHYTLEASEDRPIPITEVRQFCKNAAFLRLIRNNFSLNEDMDFGMRSESFLAELGNEETMNALWYLIMNQCEGFFDDHGRYPCAAIGDEEVSAADKEDVLGRVERQITKLVGDKAKVPKLKEAVEEVCRYGGSELHAVASFLGGAAAQEVIKLITHQYVPFDNTLVFDGNNGQGSVFCL